MEWPGHHAGQSRGKHSACYSFQYPRTVPLLTVIEINMSMAAATRRFIHNSPCDGLFEFVAVYALCIPSAAQAFSCE